MDADDISASKTSSRPYSRDFRPMPDTVPELTLAPIDGGHFESRAEPIDSGWDALEVEFAKSDRAHHEAKVSGALNRWSDNRALNEQNAVDAMAGGSL